MRAGAREKVLPFPPPETLLDGLLDHPYRPLTQLRRVSMSRSMLTNGQWHEL
jgi:hypothetical protein